MSNNYYRSEFVQNLKHPFEAEERFNFKHNEWKIAVYGLCFSLSVICGKVFYANRNALYNLLYEDKLLFETIDVNGEVMYHYIRATVLRSSPILFPLFCGAMMTAFTWLMVYLDSSVPGIQPPSPFSPNKYKVRSGHSFHLGYVIAIVNGLLVFLLMLVNGIDIN